jgi:hypothetical protein
MEQILQLSPDELTPRCDAEIGSRASRWHGCQRRAVVCAEKRGADGDSYYLFFCRKHKAKAKGDRLRPSVSVKVL